MITNERKLALRKNAAALARRAVERIADVVPSVLALSADEGEYVSKYVRVLAKKINHTVFVDEAEL